MINKAWVLTARLAGLLCEELRDIAQEMEERDPKSFSDAQELKIIANKFSIQSEGMKKDYPHLFSKMEK